MRMSNTKLDSEAFLERTLKKMDDCDYETALKDINVGIEFDPNDAGLIYGRGRIKICLEDYELSSDIIYLKCAHHFHK